MFKKKSEENTDIEMSFVDHLDELRKRIIWALISVCLTCIVAACFINNIMEGILLKPAKNAGLELQNLKPFGQPFLYFKIILVAGLVLASPFILYQLWKFVAPGLYHKEKKWVAQITIYTSLCFISGIVFSYFVMVPSMLAFAANFGTQQIKNIIDVNEFFSFLIMIILASGILFEMPVAAYILAKFGIVKAKTMSKYRRHSIIIILIVAAVATPTPDPISQLIFAAPLFVLYEISIIIAKIAEKKSDSPAQE